MSLVFDTKETCLFVCGGRVVYRQEVLTASGTTHAARELWYYVYNDEDSTVKSVLSRVVIEEWTVKRRKFDS